MVLVMEVAAMDTTMVAINQEVAIKIAVVVVVAPMTRDAIVISHVRFVVKLVILQKFKNFQSPKRSMNSASGYNGADPVWYTDSGATDHITRELDKLTMREQYNGHDRIHGPNGKGMDIRHIGHSLYYTPKHNFRLNNILYALDASKNLLSVHRLAKDNNAFLEHWPNFFSIKDQDMGPSSR
jgi:hypothetical protein